MKTAAILLVVLVASVCASNMFNEMPLNFGASRSILTLLTQVEAKLKTNGPLDAITRMLDDFKKTVNDEQIAHDGLFARQEKECASEYEFREKAVREAEGALKSATETLNGCQAQSIRAKGDLDTTKKQLMENRNFLASLLQLRKQEEYDFETITTGL
jgi:hypothetical protein